MSLDTGLMGLPMAGNLLNAGYSLNAWNRTAEKAAALEPLGAQIAVTAAEAVDSVDFIISMLADGNVLHEVLDDSTLRDSLASGAIWIDMSSTQPDEAMRAQKSLSHLGVAFVDAPVSGGTRGAEHASLAIMVGAEEKDFARVSSILMSLGRPVHVGSVGSGQLAKLANQLIVGCTIGAVAEAMLLLEKGGANPVAVRDALKGGFADSIILQQHGERMTQRNFIPGGLSRTQLKDLENVLLQAANDNLKLPMTEQLQHRFKRYVFELDGGDKDHSGIFEELIDLNT